MFTPDLLHDADAEVARLSVEVDALRAEVEALRAENSTQREQLAGREERLSARDAVWDWFGDGGPENEDDRDAVAGRICRTFLKPGHVEPSLVTVAAVTLAQSQPSGLSDAEVVSAAVACRQAITHIELTQAQLTRELAWRYQARHPHELDLSLETKLPEWVRDPEERALTAAIEEVAAVARTSPSGLRARVEMLATWPEEHGRLYRALLEGTISTTRARDIARQTERLEAGRARDWVEKMILPVAEQLGVGGVAEPDRAAGRAGRPGGVSADPGRRGGGEGLGEGQSAGLRPGRPHLSGVDHEHRRPACRVAAPGPGGCLPGCGIGHRHRLGIDRYRCSRPGRHFDRSRHRR
ncbi:MAG: hypothetical protein U0Q19_06150 [Kineosporiaceae bacterium]